MKKYYKFEIGVTGLSILSIVFIVVLFILHFGFVNNAPMVESDKYFGIALIAYFFYLAIHEVFHGIGFSLFAKDKKSIKYGAALEKGVFYAMCQERISKKAIIISLLFPLIFLTFVTYPIAIIFNLQWLAVLSLLNFAGAVGDLALFGLIIKLPKDIQYIDYDNVIGAYLISENDLSKYKAPFCKYIECGEDSDELINKNIKFITITKVSWWYAIGIFVVAAVLYFI